MAKPALPASQIREAVEARLGPVSDFEPLPEGLVSQVFAFRRDGEAFVVRAGYSRNAYEKDALVARTLAGPGLPIPEVVLIVPLFADLALCISRRAAGRRVNDLDPEEAARLAPAVLEALGEIGRTEPAEIAGWGRFDDAGAPWPTWRAYLLRFSAGAEAWTNRLPAADAGMIRRVLALVEQLAPDKEPERRLIHGDFGSANLIADGTRITAVLDWDLAALGDALYDVANLQFWNEARLAPVCDALRRRHHDQRRTLLCYQLRIGVEEVRQAVTGGITYDLGWLLGRLRALLDAAAS